MTLNKLNCNHDKMFAFEFEFELHGQCVFLAVCACTHVCMSECLSKFYGDCLIKQTGAWRTQPFLGPERPPTRRGQQMGHLLETCPMTISKCMSSQITAWITALAIARLFTTLYPSQTHVHSHPWMLESADTVKILQLDHELQYTWIQFVLHHSFPVLLKCPFWGIWIFNICLCLIWM